MKALIFSLLFFNVTNSLNYAQSSKTPSFPGGQRALQHFIYSHLEYPSLALELGMEGKLILQLNISKTGKVEKIKVVKGVGAGCDTEGIKMVRKMPDWVPAILNGQAVKAKVRIEIDFKMW